jgi:site-specific DNA recombinase
MASSTALKRAVSVVRVSDVNGRDKDEGVAFISPEDQDRTIDGLCASNKLTLVARFEELNKSAFSRSLSRRPGLLPAVEMIERGEADVIVVAYFDRLFRKSAVQVETMARIDRAGGGFLTGDAGEIVGESIASAGQWAIPQLFGFMAEFQARQVRDKTRGAKVRAVANGIPPFSNIPLGYYKDMDKTSPTYRRLLVNEAEAEVVRELFERRASGESLKTLRDWLLSRGIHKSWRAVQEMLKNRMYLGELHFGKNLVNLHSHQGIIDAGRFREIQKQRQPRGRREKSVRLLARQDLVVCATCGGRLVVGGQQRRDRLGNSVRYVDYRCNPVGTCTRRVSISAEVLERSVAEWVVARLERAHEEGHATVGSASSLRDAEAALQKAEATYQQAQRNALTLDLMREPGTQQFLEELKAARDEASEHLDGLRLRLGVTETVSAADWPRMSLVRQRALIRALIERIVVGPAGGDRIDIRPRES